MVNGLYSQDDVIEFGNFIRDNYFLNGSLKMISYNTGKYPNGTVEQVFDIWIAEKTLNK